MGPFSDYRDTFLKIGHFCVPSVSLGTCHLKTGLSRSSFLQGPGQNGTYGHLVHVSFFCTPQIFISIRQITFITIAFYLEVNDVFSQQFQKIQNSFRKSSYVEGPRDQEKTWRPSIQTRTFSLGVGE